MRFLIAISILQATLLAIVAFRMNDLDVRTGKVEAAIRANAVAALDDNSGLTAGPSAGEIRSIIREELAGIDRQAPADLALSEASNKSIAARANGPSAEEVARLQMDVQRDLDFYVGQGAMSDAQMAQLQQKIARLPAEERREALTKLTKLLNSGDFDARL